jgi:hypothetical protein
MALDPKTFRPKKKPQPAVAVTYRLLAENSNVLTTEAGDKIRTEQE